MSKDLNCVFLFTFDVYINVKISRFVQSVKYICKYVIKDSDQVAFALENTKKGVDKVKLYESVCYINGMEAQRWFGGFLDTLSMRGIHFFSSCRTS